MKKTSNTGTGQKTHGLSKHRLFHIWIGMKQRCENPNSQLYKLYGLRGITVCEEWHDFPTFFKWAMTHGYSEELSIDRVNVNGNYCPDNCRWATNVEQQRNKRNNRLLEYDGQTRCLSEWAILTGISASTIWLRLNRGWSVSEALTVESSYSNGSLERRHTNPLAISINTPFISYKGETKCLKEWASITGISYNTLYTRYQRGWGCDRLLSKPRAYRQKGDVSNET